ncbi:FmdB family zinc ribbon protein [Prauserella cavernicola]|uniref:Zinc ribbon domain-containing protein n=1 Tax=Prauserella cavernicola TaxID=2800127 RepID=A0A934V8F6_9PSEU|nr:FmdB family zinc ribbon protein [Prauserella cavernicola]MBK1787708.1 zinc ribbon domain-containing protein [Prauserella cavernicola]
MVTYRYRCERDGGFDVRLPIGTAEPSARCPVCDGASVRVFTAPALSLGSRSLIAAIDETQKSRDEPAVVAAPPARRRRASAQVPNPALRHLPRP